jgi:nicotinamidase-related amidase
MVYCIEGETLATKTRWREPTRTARAGFDQGYEMVFAEDAMSSVSAELHEFSIKNVFPLMGRVRSVEQIVKALG